jgi:hypothetical protein
VFTARLREAFPLRADKVLSLLQAMRGGRTNDPRFHSRMRGGGARWQVIEALFRTTAQRLGLSAERGEPDVSPFRRPFQQQGLFDAK